MHWYTETGEPCHTVVGVNGKERGTTLRDARKLNLYPSVTTIIRTKSSPGLEVYKQRQLLEACKENPFFWGEDEDKWERKVLAVSREHSEAAAKRGNELHQALEDYYKHGTLSTEEEKYIVPVIKFIEERFPGVKWEAETSFTETSFGYSGAVDLHSPDDKIVLDFKTKKQTEIKNMRAYSEHHMQTAAYAVGLADGVLEAREWERYNLFISTEKKDLLNLTESKDFVSDWNMFNHLLMFWQLDKKYVPGVDQ